MQLREIAHFRSPLKTKFGIPRQSGLVDTLPGEIVFDKDFRSPDAIRGLEAFDYIWLIWGFSANKHQAKGVTVRPPRLGGNEHLGVFATRSPFRPNPIGLSSVRIERISLDTPEGPVIRVRGADLMDGTPIYDIKPYVPYADSHPEARGGFTDSTQWQRLEVELPAEFGGCLSEEERESLIGLLAEDPRPQYHDDPERIYGMAFGRYDVKFRVADGKVIVLGIE